MGTTKNVGAKVGRGAMDFAKGVAVGVARKDSGPLGIIADALIERPEEAAMAQEQARAEFARHGEVVRTAMADELRSWYYEKTGMTAKPEYLERALDSEPLRDLAELKVAARAYHDVPKNKYMRGVLSEWLASHNMTMDDRAGDGSVVLQNRDTAERVSLDSDNLMRVLDAAQRKAAEEAHAVATYEAAQDSGAMASVAWFTDNARAIDPQATYTVTTAEAQNIMKAATPLDMKYHTGFNLIERAATEQNPNIRDQFLQQAIGLMQDPEIGRDMWMDPTTAPPANFIDATIHVRDVGPVQVKDLLRRRAEFDPVYRTMQRALDMRRAQKEQEAEAKAAERQAKVQENIDSEQRLFDRQTAKERDNYARNLNAASESKKQFPNYEAASDHVSKLGFRGQPLHPNVVKKAVAVGMTEDEVLELYESSKAAGQQARGDGEGDSDPNAKFFPTVRAMSGR